jgi:hypothetical protein
VCCGKNWRQVFGIEECKGYRTNDPIKNTSYKISKPVEDIVTVGSYFSWGHIDAGGTSRISYLPAESNIMKLWIYAKDMYV